MLEILISWLSPIRYIFIWIDSVAFSLIDDAYSLIMIFAKAELLSGETMRSMVYNVYVIISIFAMFKLALLLVNAMINPDKLTEKGNGLGNVAANIIITFVLLIATPFAFDQAYKIQGVIVGGNYVQRMFIDVGKLGDKNPGDMMRDIAIKTLIYPNEYARKKCSNGGGTKNCTAAIEAYDKMNDTGFSFTTLSKYIGVSIKDEDGSEVYVYEYMILVTTVVGGFITYVLFSFGFDIALRLVELTVLRLISPFFIATFIDPKSAKSGPFHKWLVAVGKTYASLFIKLAILALMLLFISILRNVKLDIGDDNWFLNGVARLILLISILIFAKKAPKWIGDMIGVEGDALGGLGIGKKIAGAALIGKAATKAGHTITGTVGGALSQRRALRKAQKALNKKADQNALGRAKSAAKSQRGLKNKARAIAGTYFSRDGIKKNLQNWKDTTKAGLKGVYQGAISGAELGFKAKDMKDINAQLKAQRKDTLTAAGYVSPMEKLHNKISKSGEKQLESVIGSKSAQQIRQENIKNKELAEDMLGRKLYMNSKGDLFLDEGMTDIAPFNPKTIRKKYGGVSNGIEDIVASEISGKTNSTFTTKEITSQTYIEPTTGNMVTTGPISAGTLVANKTFVNAAGKEEIVYDNNGNAVKEAVVDTFTGNHYKINDTEIKKAIEDYKKAAEDNTGSTDYDLNIGGKTLLHLTGQGVLEYEAALSSIKEENAKNWISVNEKKNEIAQQLAELQSNFSSAQNSLSNMVLNTEYEKTKKLKEELIDKMGDFSRMISGTNTKINALENDIIKSQKDVNYKFNTQLQKMVEAQTRELENLKNERNKLSIKYKADSQMLSDCNAKLSDATVISEYNTALAQRDDGLSSIVNRMKSLQEDQINTIKEQNSFVNYGSDIIVKVAGQEEALNAANSSRVLSEASRQKTKTRENADNYKNDKKNDSK